MNMPIITSSSISIKVIPSSRTDEYVGMMSDGSFKIKLKASPTDGKANIALLNFLKEKTQTEWKIISGFTSPRKIVTKK